MPAAFLESLQQVDLRSGPLLRFRQSWHLQSQQPCAMDRWCRWTRTSSVCLRQQNLKSVQAQGLNRLNQKWSNQLVLVILILLVLLVIIVIIIIIIIIVHHYIDQSYPWSNLFKHSSHLHKDVQDTISISQNQWDPWKNQKNAPCFLSHAMVAFLRAATSSRLRTCATINRPSDSTDVFLLALRLHQQEWED